MPERKDQKGKTDEGTLNVNSAYAEGAVKQNSYLCDYIKEHPDTWEKDLSSEPYNLKIKKDGEFILFTYPPGADFTIPLVKEARGIILTFEEGEPKPVCRPFDKFGNFGEAYADTERIDWNSVRVEEKVDGSLIKLWFYKDEWHVSTNNTIGAETARVEGEDLSYLDLFKKSSEGKLDLSRLNKENTYLFELIGPDNKIIISYPERDIVHIGTRNTLTGKEYKDDIGIRQPRTYDLHSLSECREFVQTMNKHDQVDNEGFVVVDKAYHRIKVKTPEYLVAHHTLAQGAVSDEKVLHLIRTGEIEEAESYSVKLKDRADVMRGRMRAFARCEKHYISRWRTFMKRNDFVTRKYYAEREHQSPYFATAVKAIFEDAPIDRSSQSDKRYLSDMERSEKATLHILVGVSGSGKSTFALKNKEDGDVYISSDLIRKELTGSEEDQSVNAKVFALLHKRAKEALKSGKTVWADATHLSRRERRTLINAVGPSAHLICADIIACSLDECIRNDSERERSVGKDVILKQAGRFDMPFHDEGIDLICIHHTGQTIAYTEEVEQKILERMDGFDQSSIWHSEDLKEHSESALTFFEEDHRNEREAFPLWKKRGALLHDFGKLTTRSEKNGEHHFYNHDRVGAWEVMSRFTFPDQSREDTLQMLFLIGYHMYGIFYNRGERTSTFGKDNGRLLERFSKADHKASIPKATRNRQDSGAISDTSPLPAREKDTGIKKHKKGKTP